MSSKLDKELLRDILDGMQVIHNFLSTDLSRERLSQENERNRQRHIDTLSTLANRIHSSHPSIRPRMDTPGKMTKPPVGAKKPAPLPIPTESDEEEEEKRQQNPPTAEAEDYLPFEPVQRDDTPQEMYEPMNPTEDVQEDFYEEPAATLSPLPDEPTDTYEEPEFIHPGPPTLPAPTPPSSRENSGSGAVYTLTQMGNNNGESEVSHDWQYDTMAPRVEKMKVSELRGVVQKGYLDKLGGKNKKSWQKRYCVQAGAFMYFYEKESSKTFNNRITLPNYIVNPAPNWTNAKKKQFSFKLSSTDTIGKKKDYYFKTTSDEDRQKWIQTIRAAYEKAASVAAQRLSMTLPRMPSEQPAPGGPRPKRASSFGDEGEDVYEDIGPLDEEPQEEYVAVSPQPEDIPGEEYVDVQPGQREGDDSPQEEYEDTSSFQAPPPSQPSIPSRAPQPSQFALPPRAPPSQPPPPTQPPPPSHAPPSQPPPPTQPPPPSHAPPPPSQPPPPSRAPDPEVNTTKIYYKNPNGIRYENIFVALWDFPAAEQDELNLRRGDLVFVNDPKESSDWWYGELLDEEAASKVGVNGFFPCSYLTTAFEALTA